MNARSKESFSARVKAELCGKSLPVCCRLPALYGILLFGKKFSRSGIEFNTENKTVAELAVKLLADCAGVAAQSFMPGKKKIVVRLEDKNELQRVLELFGSPRPGRRNINYAVLDGGQEQPGEPSSEESLLQEDAESSLLTQPSCCYRAFLAGAFLSCGSIGEPTRQYHLELAVPFPRLADSLAQLLGELNLAPKRTKRGEHGTIRVLYYKDNERIADFLGLIGAVDASLGLAEIAIEKTLRNKVNRQTNSDTANLNRAAVAAVRQLEAVRCLEQNGTLESLPAPLREAAALRKAYPEASLTELCRLGELSRSSLYSRLSRIEKLAGGS